MTPVILGDVTVIRFCFGLFFLNTEFTIVALTNQTDN